MPYQFKKFPGRGRGFSPRASVRKNGQIGFNAGAVMHYELQQFRSAELYYDEANEVIGIRLVEGTGDQAAVKLVHRPGNSYVAAKSFFDFFNIQRGQTKRYELSRDDDSGILIMQLRKPVGGKKGKEALDSKAQMW